jgi:hypothetical protein
VPNGAPKKKTPVEIKSLARAYAEGCMRVLGAFAIGENTDPDIRIRAIGMLLDRGWGKPAQDNNHSISGEVRVVLRKMLDDEDRE